MAAICRHRGDVAGLHDDPRAWRASFFMRRSSSRSHHTSERTIHAIVAMDDRQNVLSVVGRQKLYFTTDVKDGFHVASRARQIGERSRHAPRFRSRLGCNSGVSYGTSVNARLTRISGGVAAHAKNHPSTRRSAWPAAAPDAVPSVLLPCSRPGTAGLLRGGNNRSLVNPVLQHFHNVIAPPRWEGSRSRSTSALLTGPL